jgi:hypothetical protein
MPFLTAPGAASTHMISWISVSLRRLGRCLSTSNLLALCALPCLMLCLGTVSQTSTDSPQQDYLVYVVCESVDKIVLLRFGQGGLRVESQTRTGLMPTDINGPHGIAVSQGAVIAQFSIASGFVLTGNSSVENCDNQTKTQLQNCRNPSIVPLRYYRCMNMGLCAGRYFS